LTASERRVADLAADGLPNRDLAQTLYVTAKMVEVHLCNAYRKLGVGSRRDLPAGRRRLTRHDTPEVKPRLSRHRARRSAACAARR
jgi:DNA-binding NarL/FixJ family response regulator